MIRKILMIAGVVAGGIVLGKTIRRRSGAVALSTVRESITVNVPVSTAYNQWTQFEDFPQFMRSVDEVRQIDDTHLHWRATVAGKEKEWDAEITEQVPDQRIAWRSTSGVANEGVVTFEAEGDDQTCITLEMTYMPDTLTEEIGDTLGAVKLQTKENLRKFKRLLESRGMESGAWRGSVAAPH